MTENRKKEEIFTVCPNNQGFLVGCEGTIKDRNTNEVLEQVVTQNGYLQVKNSMVTNKNPRKYEYVHRLIALTYVPGYSHINWICHHKDKDRRNNSPQNLLWTSEFRHSRLHNNFRYIRWTA